MREAEDTTEVREAEGAAVVCVVKRTLLEGVIQSVVLCGGVTDEVCGVSRGISDCIDLCVGAAGRTGGALEGALEGVNSSPGDVTRAAVYSLDGDSDLTIEKGGSGSPLAELSSSGKWLVMVPNMRLHSSELKSGRS